MSVRGKSRVSDSENGAAQHYTRVAMALHWIMAGGIMALIAIGLLMVHANLQGGTVFRLYQLHKSIGITLLLLVCLRVVWRLTHKPPAWPVSMPFFERRAARIGHGLLYAALIGLPLSGWAVVSSSVFALPTRLFGLVPWPDLPVLPDLTDKAPVEALFQYVHAYGAYALIALLVVHIGAALRHRFWLRDTVMSRMLPFRRGTRS